MILHLDADSFFASCAQAINPGYRGKPLVTGAERSIATSISYEAKKLGIKRATPIFEIKNKFPQVIITSSDYQTYSLFSKKMFSIVRRYTPTVEEYSIDEAFADISGMRQPLNMTYSQIGLSIKNSIESELGISVSVGIAPSKVLAKVASSWNKPSGMALIKKSDILSFLSTIPVEKIWGVGPQTKSFLNKKEINTAGQLIQKSEGWVNYYLTKPHQEIWKELQGKSIYTVTPGIKDSYKSISKTRTFSPLSKDKRFVFSQLSKNLEKAFAKARRYNLGAKEINIFIKQHGAGGRYKSYYQKVKLPRKTSFPNEVLPLIKSMYNNIFRSNINYRATGVILSDLKDDDTTQFGLFDDILEHERIERLYNSVDKIQKKYGRDTVYLGTSLDSKDKAIRFHQKPHFLTYSLLRENETLTG